MRLVTPALLVVLLVASSSPPDPPRGPCGTEPSAPFGPAMSLADSGRVFASTLTQDGHEFWFFKKVGSDEDYRIYRSRRDGDGWSEPERVALGGEYSDLYPSISPDGRRLVFSSYRPVAGDNSGHPNAHLWMAERRGAGWSPPVLLPASRIGSYHSGLRQDSSGTLHLRITSPDWSRNEPMRLRWSGSGYVRALEADGEPAAEYWRAHLGDSMHVWGEVRGPEGLTLVQVSRVEGDRRRFAPGRYFVTRPTNGGWTPLVPAVGGLGSGSPNFAWFGHDGCHVHYTRDYSSFERVSLGAAQEEEASGARSPTQR